MLLTDVLGKMAGSKEFKKHNIQVKSIFSTEDFSNLSINTVVGKGTL